MSLKIMITFAIIIYFSLFLALISGFIHPNSIVIIITMIFLQISFYNKLVSQNLDYTEKFLPIHFWYGIGSFLLILLVCGLTSSFTTFFDFASSSAEC